MSLIIDRWVVTLKGIWWEKKILRPLFQMKKLVCCLDPAILGLSLPEPNPNLSNPNRNPNPKPKTLTQNSQRTLHQRSDKSAQKNL